MSIISGHSTVSVYYLARRVNHFPFADFHVDSMGLTTGAIIEIVIASLLGLALILVVLWMKGFFGGNVIEDKGGVHTFQSLSVGLFLIIRLQIFFESLLEYQDSRGHPFNLDFSNLATQYP